MKAGHPSLIEPRLGSHLSITMSLPVHWLTDCHTTRRTNPC
uniref:Uncharacterized protein n=1 Tax=Anguilla anguilla TaxID=7936 RepID=A0A0E9Q8X4_ANGAN